MKTAHATEAYGMTRLAPYLLAGVLAALGWSLLQGVPPIGYLLVGAGSGALACCFHVLKWRTGKEGFQVGAVAAWMLPFFTLLQLSHRSGIRPGLAYCASFTAGYLFGLVLLRRRIRKWVIPPTKALAG